MSIIRSITFGILSTSIFLNACLFSDENADSKGSPPKILSISTPKTEFKVRENNQYSTAIQILIEGEDLDKDILKLIFTNGKGNTQEIPVPTMTETKGSAILNLSVPLILPDTVNTTYTLIDIKGNVSKTDTLKLVVLK